MYTLAEAVMRCGVALPVVLLFLLLFGAPSSARAEERHFGAKAGPNFAVLSLDADYEGESYDRRIAVGGGGFVVLPVNQRLAVQLEALYNPKGAKLFDEELGATSTLLLNYLDFPVLARVTGPAPRSLHVFAGPYAGVRVGATRQIAASGGGITSGIRENMGDEVKRFDYGVIAGGGLHVGQRVIIDGRYAWGFATVNADTPEGTRFRHRLLTVMVGMRF